MLFSLLPDNGAAGEPYAARGSIKDSYIFVLETINYP
jgi:hypothetical protein